MWVVCSLFTKKKTLALKKLTQVSAMKERSYWLTQNKRENKRTAYNNWNRNPSQHLLGTQNWDRQPCSVGNQSLWHSVIHSLDSVVLGQKLFLAWQLRHLLQPHPRAYQLFNTLLLVRLSHSGLAACGIDLVENARFISQADKVVSLAWHVERKCAALSDVTSYTDSVY